MERKLISRSAPPKKTDRYATIAGSTIRFFNSIEDAVISSQFPVEIFDFSFTSIGLFRVKTVYEKVEKFESQPADQELDDI